MKQSKYSKKPIKIVSFSHVVGKLTPKQEKYVESRKRYYKTLMALREERKRLGLSQEELAKRAKLPRTTISKIESGNRNVTIEKVMAIAEAMDKEVEIRLR